MASIGSNKPPIGLKRSLNTEKGVHMPHGSHYGYDICPDIDTTFRFCHVEDYVWINESFKKAFGCSLSPRFGEKIGAPLHGYLPQRDLHWKKKKKQYISKMREYFELYYFLRQPVSAKKPAGRSIYFAFQESLSIIVQRLEDANGQNLKDIVVIALPFSNKMSVDSNNAELKKSNLTREQFIAQKMIESYKLYCQLFKPVLQ